MKKLKRLLDLNVLLQDSVEHSERGSGLLVANSEMGKNVMKATVIQVGDDCKCVEVGDDVYYKVRTESPITIGDESYVITDERNIVCIL